MGRLLQVGAGEDEGGAAGGRLGDDVPEFLARDGVDSDRGLIQKQQCGLVHERAPKGETLFHPSRQASGQPVASRPSDW